MTPGPVRSTERSPLCPRDGEGSLCDRGIIATQPSQSFAAQMPALPEGEPRFCAALQSCTTLASPSGRGAPVRTLGRRGPPGRSIAFLQARPAGPRPQGAPDPRRKPAGHPPKTARNPPGHRLPRTRPRRSGRPGFPRADGRSSHRHQPRPGETRWPGTGAHPGRERPPGAGTAETNPK